MLNIGLAGLKGHQSVILEGLSKLPNVRLAAVADDNPAALAGVPHWPAAGKTTHCYSDWREMLQQEELDLVGVCGTDGERAEVLIAGAERGLHLLSEKPLAMSLDELASVRRAVAAGGVRLSMLLTMRFEPAYRVIREQVAAGRIGEVVLASMAKSYRLGDRPEWQRDRRTFSGIIPFIGIHALDLIRWTTGREFTAVMAYQSNAAHPEIRDMEDNASLALKLDNGGSACVRLDYCRSAAAPTHGDDRLRIAGSAGVIESVACGAGVTLITGDEPPHDLPLPPPENQFVDYVNALLAGRECGVPAEDCFRLTEVALKGREAAVRGTPMALGI